MIHLTLTGKERNEKGEYSDTINIIEEDIDELKNPRYAMHILLAVISDGKEGLDLAELFNGFDVFTGYNAETTDWLLTLKIETATTEAETTFWFNSVEKVPYRKVTRCEDTWYSIDDLKHWAYIRNPLDDKDEAFNRELEESESLEEATDILNSYDDGYPFEYVEEWR